MTKKIEPAKRATLIKHATRDLVPIAKEIEKQGKKVIYLNIGDPIAFGFRTPKHLWEAINSNQKLGEKYSDSLGNEKARQAVAEYAQKNGVKGITKEDTMTFTGGSEAIILSMQALFNPKENCLIPCPGYSMYNGELAFLEAEAKEYYLEEEKDWEIDLESLEKNINEKTKAIVIINPNNPTGSVLKKNMLKKVIDIAGSNNLLILADETYDKIIYDEEKFIPIASLSKDVPIISYGSISKNYLAPGFRGGWLYKHDPLNQMQEYFETIKKLARLRLSPPSPIQFAIEAALKGPQDHIKEMITILQKRRDITYKRLNEIEKISCTKPKGAFYAFPKINTKIESDKDFVIDLAKEKGVLTVHGEGFGQKEGTKHFRIIFLPEEQILEEALNKIEEYMKEKFTK
ncbi:MAG: aminotransferase class I/II-fold pyridoxal phosphate-dependent enzyme [Candidatus Diapherotrites archaeon]